MRRQSKNSQLLWLNSGLAAILAVGCLAPDSSALSFGKKKQAEQAQQQADEDALQQQQEEEGPKPDTVEFAKMQLSKSDFKGALTTYKTIFLARPYDAEVLLGIAYASERLGNLDEAIKYARQAATADAKTPEPHIALGHYLEENRDLKAAYLQYERACDLKPSRDLMEQIWAPMVRILVGLGDVPQAVLLAHKWVQKYPDEPTVQYNNAWVAAQAGDDKHTQEAVDSYEKAIQLDPSLVGAHYNVALLHVKLGQNDAAATELDQFIKLAPTDPDVKQAKTLLTKLKASGAQPITFTPDFSKIKAPKASQIRKAEAQMKADEKADAKAAAAKAAQAAKSAQAPKPKKPVVEKTAAAPEKTTAADVDPGAVSAIDGPGSPAASANDAGSLMRKSAGNLLNTK